METFKTPVAPPRNRRHALLGTSMMAINKILDPKQDVEIAMEKTSLVTPRINPCFKKLLYTPKLGMSRILIDSEMLDSNKDEVDTPNVDKPPVVPPRRNRRVLFDDKLLYTPKEDVSLILIDEKMLHHSRRYISFYCERYGEYMPNYKKLGKKVRRKLQFDCQKAENVCNFFIGEPLSPIPNSEMLMSFAVITEGRNHHEYIREHDLNYELESLMDLSWTYPLNNFWNSIFQESISSHIC